MKLILQLIKKRIKVILTVNRNFLKAKKQSVLYKRIFNNKKKKLRLNKKKINKENS